MSNPLSEEYLKEAYRNLGYLDAQLILEISAGPNSEPYLDFALSIQEGPKHKLACVLNSFTKGNL